MTWFRCGGGSGMPADLKNRMNAVFNKKFGTAVDYPAEGWPDNVNFMGPLPEKTIVSSPIADFSDGADDVPTKSLIVTIPPTLSGVSSVTEKQTGRNLASGGVYEYNSRNMIIAPVYLKAGTYTVSFNRGVNVQYIYIRKGDTVSLVGDAYATKSNSTFFTFTADEDTYYYAQLYRTNTSDTWEDYPVTQPQIELGSTAHAYEPYQTPTIYTASLGRTIYGGEVDIVNGQGQETYNRIDLGSLDWTYDNVNSRFQTVIGTVKQGSVRTTEFVCNDFTVIDDGRPIAQVPDKSVYNGSGSYVYIHDSDYTNPSTFKTAVSGMYLAFPLATPTDFTFDGQEINTRLGYNAFWSDQGDTEVTYRADISLALQAASGSRGLMMASRPAIEPANGDQGSEESTENNIETEGEEDAR